MGEASPLGMVEVSGFKKIYFFNYSRFRAKFNLRALTPYSYILPKEIGMGQFGEKIEIEKLNICNIPLSESEEYDIS